MASTYRRLEVIRALDDMVLREDGLTFQRLARRLFRERVSTLTPHAEHNDLGRDATIRLYGQTSFLLTSLDARLEKVRTDLKRVLETRPNIRNVVFCTAKGITNAQIEKWQEAIRSDFGVELEVLERNWVVDECLRETNQLIVYDELRIAPRNLPVPQPMVGPILALTEDHQAIGHYSQSNTANRSYVAWYQPSTNNSPDTVTLTEIRQAAEEALIIPQAADCECLAIGHMLYMSWIQRDFKTGMWDLFVTVYDKLGGSSHVNWVAHNVKSLQPQPFPCLYQGQPYLVFLTSLEGQTSLLHAAPCNAEEPVVPPATPKIGRPAYRETASFRLPAARNMIVRSDENHILVAAASLDTIRLLALGNDGWRELGQFSHHHIIARFDFAIDRDSVIFILETIGSNLATVIFDLVTREWGDLWYISSHGKWPSIAVSGNHRVISWIGAPPLPTGLQGQLHEGTSMELYMRALEQIALDTKKLVKMLASDGELSMQEVLREDLIHSLAHVWAPLWLGALSEAGECIGTLGPLGYGSRANWDTSVSLHGNRGLLIWQSGVSDSYYDCSLMAREIAFP